MFHGKMQMTGSEVGGQSGETTGEFARKWSRSSLARQFLLTRVFATPLRESDESVKLLKPAIPERRL
jgi:hypothetical protein